MGTPVPSLESEFSGADLGDLRRTKRLQKIAELAAANPSLGFPRQAGTSGVLEGTYRFLNNPKVTAEQVLAAHTSKVVERASDVGKVLVLHDTTQFLFGGDEDRDGLGRASDGGKQGFLAHVSFAVSEDGLPLGTLAIESWARVDKRKKPRTHHETKYAPGKESERWAQAVEVSAEKLQGHVEHAVHVMDREGDAYELLAAMVEHGRSFIVRLAHDRRLAPGRNADAEHLYELLAEAPVVGRRSATLSHRSAKKPPAQTRRFAKRKGREAWLELRARPVEIFIGNGSPAHFPPSLKLNAVEAREYGAPAGEPEVLWRLLTTEPIDTEEDVARVVDAYRMRWRIEELFKALKTGCRFESLQLETGRALQIALAIHISVAWRMLLLRWASRELETLPAKLVLTPTQMAALKVIATRAKRKLSAEPTVREALLAVAGHGGHLMNNGDPGWQTIGHGFRDLLFVEQIQDILRSDQ